MKTISNFMDKSALSLSFSSIFILFNANGCTILNFLWHAVLHADINNLLNCQIIHSKDILRRKQKIIDSGNGFLVIIS
jgi:hypothetical protein